MIPISGSERASHMGVKGSPRNDYELREEVLETPSTTCALGQNGGSIVCMSYVIVDISLDSCHFI